MNNTNQKQQLESPDSVTDNGETGQIISNTSIESEKSDSEVSFVEEVEPEVIQETKLLDNNEPLESLDNDQNQGKQKKVEEFPVSLKQAKNFLKEMLKAYYIQKIKDKTSPRTSELKESSKEKKQNKKSSQKKQQKTSKNWFGRRKLIAIMISILIILIAQLAQLLINAQKENARLSEMLADQIYQTEQLQRSYDQQAQKLDEITIQLSEESTKLSEESQKNEKLQKKNKHLLKAAEFAVKEEKRNCDLLDIKDIIFSTFKNQKHQNIIDLCTSYEQYLQLENKFANNGTDYEEEAKNDNVETDDDKNQFNQKQSEQDQINQQQNQTQNEPIHSQLKQSLKNKINSIKSSFFNILNKIPSLKMSETNIQESEQQQQEQQQEQINEEKEDQQQQSEEEEEFKVKKDEEEFQQSNSAEIEV